MTKEESDLVLNNINLARKIAWEYNKKFMNSIEYEELESISYYGLTKAAITFDKSKNYEFSTYAYTVMKNEILYYFNKNQTNTISLSKELNEDFELHEIIPSIENTSELTESNIQLKLLNQFINELSEIENKIVNYYLSGLKINQIQKLTGLASNDIYIIYREAKSKLRTKFFKYWGTEL